MVTESIIAATFLKALKDVNKSIEMDKAATKKYAKAFTRNQEAITRLNNKAELMDKRLENVANKKRAILHTSFPEFIRVYENIQKINMEQGSQKEERLLLQNIRMYSPEGFLRMVSPEELTNKQMVCTYLFGGIGRLMVRDSERKLSAAKKTLSAANICAANAESAEAICDAVIERANRLAALLVRMNILFVNVTKNADSIIQRNGYDVRSYEEYDKGVLMTMVNIADAIFECVKIPVVDEDGKLYESAVELIRKNEEYLDKLNKTI